MISVFEHTEKILVLLFLLITFTLSFIEKISDWKGNVNFIKEHLKNTIFKNHIPLLLLIIVILEITAIIFMAFGIFEIIAYNNFVFGFYGLLLCAVILIFLLVGQRLAKDYVGATSLTVYFILTIFGIFLLNH